MTQFIVEHPYLFAILCIFATFATADELIAWANAWALRKHYEREAEK